jgi:hypothetical protein
MVKSQVVAHIGGITPATGAFLIVIMVRPSERYDGLPYWIGSIKY